MFTYFVSADIFNLSADCEKDYCIPDRYTNWNLTITNKGESEINLIGFRIVDIISLKSSLTWEKDFPQNIISSSSRIFSVNGKIPFANLNNTFVAQICIITQPPPSAWSDVATKKLEYCSTVTNFTFKITPCLENYDCKGTHICQNMSCVPLNCTYCQFAEEHQCNNYECCDNIDCLNNQKCVNNKCTSLNCSNEEYLLNHNCTKTNCEWNQTIINFTCIPLNCTTGNIILNHECQPNNCSEDEYLLNYKCNKLNCSSDYAKINHSCIKLNCTNDESNSNNSCNKLKCSLFKTPESHECRVNSSLILYLFLILTIIILIKIIHERKLYLEHKKSYDFYYTNLNAKKTETIKIENSEIKKEQVPEQKNNSESNGEKKNG